MGRSREPPVSHAIRTIRAFGFRYGCSFDTFQSSSPPILGLLELLIPEVLKTERYAEIFSSQELNDRLQVILLLSGDSDLAILQLALNV
jgi:hypothetical protein